MSVVQQSYFLVGSRRDIRARVGIASRVRVVHEQKGLPMVGHYRITLLGRTAAQTTTRLIRFHAPEGKDVLEASRILMQTLEKLPEEKRLSVTRVNLERIDANGHIV